MRATAATRRLSGDTTHFGEKTVPKEAKEGLVRGVFSSVASNYDVMNDFMSGGLHRFWKDDFVGRLGLGAVARASGEAPRCLDVAGGTGDAAFSRAAERGIAEACMVFEEGNAQSLPCADDSFDFATISFGLRNVTDIDAALVEMRRVLKPGGRFDRVVIPELGHRVADDRASYEYLVESIRKHRPSSS
ncbi:2-octaprenyl-6-methoxy-1,4-benzoquinone methylase [Aureococcus anophagefferens]|uniref:2-octaprenyl-6-methoxy-1,4-benzoquinone methylase n=1 Tax=Aureococcus anophagefferens TaxID=44056 RepID=A0ABR1GE48_AURAN